MPLHEQEPLLACSTSPTKSYKSPPSDEDIESRPTTAQEISRSIEDDVLPIPSSLGRTITWSSAYILIISRVIGSGIFATPGVIVKSVGSVGLSLSLWLVGALIAACGLAVGLEYGCMLPRSGGDKVYLEFVYRKPQFLASTLVATQAVLLGFTASNCIVFAQYTIYAFDMKASDALQKSLAVLLLTVITIIHGCWPRAGIKIQDFLGWIKVSLVIFMILTGLLVVVLQPRGIVGVHHHFPTGADLWKDTDWSLGTMSTSLFKVFYSFAGLDNVNNVMNEVRDPVRTLKSASITALTTACIMYILINVAYFIVIPLAEIKESRELIAALFFERCFGPTVGKVLLPLAVALSGAGNVMVVTFALARVNQEIARQGFLPYPKLLASSKPFNSPFGGLLAHYIPSLLVITLPPSKDVYSFILEVEGYPGQIYALALSIGLLWLRYRRPELKRPFKAWTGAIVLRIGLCLALLTAPFSPPTQKRQPKGGIWYAAYAVVGGGVLLFGALYWYIWFKLIPRLKGYRYEEEISVLEDGTTITTLIRIPSEPAK